MSNTARSAAALKAFFETGDIPTESQFSDFISSYVNIVDNGLTEGYNGNLVGVTPPNQSTAALITTRLTVANTSGSSSDGFQLPPAVVGNDYWVLPNLVDGSLIYPSLGESIIPLSTNEGLLVRSGYAYYFICLIDGVWLAIQYPFDLRLPKTISFTVSQGGTDNPDVSYLINDFAADPFITYNDVGVYNVFLGGAFVEGKTALNIQAYIGNNGLAGIVRIDTDSLQIITTNFLTGLPEDGLLENNTVTIIVQQ